jgi:hypothetical protein
MKSPAAPVTLAGAPLGEARHVCAFFGSDEEEYRVLLPFVKEGFDAGDRAVHVVEPHRCADHLRRLAAEGIDTAAAGERGQLELRTSAETYLRDGRFDTERMLATFEGLAGGGGAAGFARSRMVCRMDWAAERRPAFDDVIEFESRVNDVWRRHDDVVVCTYRTGRFGGDAVVNIMRTHPLVIVGGTLRRNPFFVPPERFLPELRARRAQGGAPPRNA